MRCTDDIDEDLKQVLEVAKSVLPSSASLIDEDGIQILPVAAEVVHDQLLQDLQQLLDSPMSDERAIAQARAIVAAVNRSSLGADAAMAVEGLEALPSSTPIPPPSG